MRGEREGRGKKGEKEVGGERVGGKKGEKGVGGGGGERVREKKAREEEERGLRGDEDYKVTLCAGVVFILKCSCTHTYLQCPSSHRTTSCLQGLPNVPKAKGWGGRRDACQGAAATLQLCQR